MSVLTQNGYHNLSCNPFETQPDPYQELRQNQIANLWEITRFLAGQSHKDLDHIKIDNALSVLADLRDLLQQ